MSSPMGSDRPGAEDSVTVAGDTVTFRVTAEQSAGAVAALEVRMPAGAGIHNRRQAPPGVDHQGRRAQQRLYRRHRDLAAGRKAATL